jgi:hypothetical protein
MKTVVAELEYEGKQYTVTRDDWDENADYLREDYGLEQLVYYMWTEGNYACDCNRILFMGLDDPDSDEFPPCGDTVKLLSLTLDGKDLLATTTGERLAAIGLVGV